MLLRTLIVCLLLVFQAVAQTAPSSAQQAPVAGVLACPPANQPIGEDPVTFTWKSGSNTPDYRLLLGPTVGSSRDGDSSLISGLEGQLAGLPGGQSLYVTLWSYDQSGNPVQPPSFCPIKTGQGQSVVTFKDVQATTLTGVSLGSFSAGSAEPTTAVAVAAQACQARCKENAGCQGYTYYPAGNGNPTAMCDLKGQITASQPNECCLSALKTVTHAAAPAVAPAVATTPAPAKGAKTTTPAKAPSPAKAAAAAKAAAPAAEVVTGDWVNQFGAITRIMQQGNAISGTYSDSKQPSLAGTLKGTFDGQTLRATLNWKSGTDKSYGSLLLTLTPQGRLEGTWTDATGVDGPWSMGPAGNAAH